MHAKGAQWFKWLGIVTLVPNGEEFPHKCGHEDWAVKETWKRQGLAEWRCDLARGFNASKTGVFFLLPLIFESSYKIGPHKKLNNVIQWSCASELFSLNNNKHQVMCSCGLFTCHFVHGWFVEVQTRIYLDAFCVYFWAGTPALFSLCTFGVFVLLGHTLDAATVRFTQRMIYIISLTYTIFVMCLI
jgi:hypothetical protein